MVVLPVPCSHASFLAQSSSLKRATHGRTPEQARTKLVLLNHTPQQSSWTKQLLLTDKIVERRRSNPLGEGLRSFDSIARLEPLRAGALISLLFVPWRWLRLPSGGLS